MSNVKDETDISQPARPSTSDESKLSSSAIGSHEHEHEHENGNEKEGTTQSHQAIQKEISTTTPRTHHSHEEGEEVESELEPVEPELAPIETDPSALEAGEAATATRTKTNGTTSSGPPYTAYSNSTRWFIVAVTGAGAFFSPLSGQIYYPVMPTLVKNYGLTTSAINISITTYMIFQGLAPSFMGTFADASGRRPAYILAFAVYTAANIGLALQNNYAALLVLRCLQSAGSSGTVSFGYGVIADVSTPGERGMLMGPMGAGIMVAPALGPVIGGLLSQYLGWRSVFWFLVIISGGYLIVYAIAMPETHRKIVGNGSMPPVDAWRLSLIQYLTAYRKKRRMGANELIALEEEQQALRAERSTQKMSFPNPLKSFAILIEPDAFLVILYVSVVSFTNFALMTSTPNAFPGLYGLNDLHVGICFL
jgi:multidrug resistance protein